jgi:surface protein
MKWTSMENAFSGRTLNSDPGGCVNLNSNATDVPNISYVSSFKEMFYDCSAFNGGNIGNWNTQNVTDMYAMFFKASSFNQPIGNWNTQRVRNMTYTFLQATAFNQFVGNWNTQNVTSMDQVFANTAFNQPIGNWNTHYVENMAGIFANTPFNQSIINWNTQNVTNMRGMFAYAPTFNQPIDTWNTQNVFTMYGMFWGATAFNQSLATWGIRRLDERTMSGADKMLHQCGMNKANYDATLIGWAAQDVKEGVQLGATGLKYCLGNGPRSTLINTKNWVITGDALDCGFSISGNAFADMNNNCTKETGEVNLKSLVVRATPSNLYGMTDVNGNYTIGVPAIGTYQVELLPQVPIGSTNTITAVCPLKTVPVTAVTPNVTNIDFGAKGKICSQLSVNVSVDRFRRCFEGNTYITYKNIGLIAANTITVKVELPVDIEAVSSVPAWTSQVGNVLTYNISQIAGQSEGTINLKHTVICGNEAIRGQSRCIKATISPANYCLPTVSASWDTADLVANNTCIDNKMGRFTIKNIGIGNMTDSSNYRIFFNDVIVRTGKVKLLANEEVMIDINNTSQVVRIEVAQTPFHPTGVAAMSFLNRCGAVPMSVAPIQQFPNLDNISTSTACAEIRDSYDPNDKKVIPSGVTAQKIVEKDQEVEFQVRFQNTGSDVAYKVVVRDTLDLNLDIATIRTINTSHTGTVSMEGVGQGVVIWTFENINLPAKSVDEVGSNGMITFRIRMKPNLVIGTVIKNKAAIYFDFNSPIITNETLIRIGTLPTDFGNPVFVNTVFPCPTLPSVAVAGANQNISTTTTTLAATPIVKGYGQWRIVQGTGTFSDEFSPTAMVTNLSFGLNIFEWKSYLCNNTSSSQVQIVVCPTITISPNTLLDAILGTNYSQTLTQVGGIGAITYSISAGTLPNGLTLNSTTGEISGIATVANTFNFTVQAQDVNNCVGTKVYSIQTVCPTITISPNTLLDATLGTNYSQTLTQIGGIGAITYSISAGTLPNGLTLNSTTGEISGVATVANTFNFTVQAKDVNNCLGTKGYTIQTICPTITISPANLNNATVGTNYSQTLTQVGGIGAITYSISAGTLPNGLTLNATTGEISGVATVANTFNFTVQAQDVNNCVGTKVYSIQTICPTITISSNSLSNAIVGTNYSQTLIQVGGIGAITYSISAGTLPNGLTLNSTTGEISGTPTVANTFNFTVQAKDVNNCLGTKVYSIQAVCPTITLAPANLNNATVGTNYSQTLTQVGGISSITYSISAGTLPNGLSLNATTGEISGVATVANTFNFTVQAKDANNCLGTKVYSIQAVCPTITISPNSLSNATVGTNYSQTLTQVGGIGAITYSISVGTLPNGLTLNSTTGEISGTPTVANTFNFTVQAKDANNCVGTKVYRVVVGTVVILPPVLKNQVTTFNSISDRPFSADFVQLIASASSGLPVSFEVTAGAATLVGSSYLSLTGVGEITVRATQNGGNGFAAAVPVTRSFRVGQAPQTLIGLEIIADRAWNTPNFYVNASSNTSLPIVFTVTEGANIAEIINGNVVRLKAAVGKVTITASQAGNANYAAATSLTRSFNVVKANQEITSIGFVPNLIYRPNLTQTLSASASSSLPVSATVVSGNATITNNIISFPTAGTSVVRYSQSGNDLWNAAVSMERTYVVGKANQEIILTSFTSPMVIGSSQTIVTNATSGLPVVMSVLPSAGAATVNGLVITPTSGNRIDVELNQAGNGNYNAATPVRFSINITPTITLTSVSGAKFCGGGAISVNFTVNGLFALNNRMIAYLSDENGVFGNNRGLIGTLDTQGSGVIVGTIPNNAKDGKGYKVRVEGIFPFVFSAASSATLEVNALPETPFIRQVGSELTSSVATNIQWFANGVAIAGATSAKYTPTQAQITANNSFSVVATSAGGCTSVSDAVRYNFIPTGVENPEFSAKLSVYPNPTIDKFTIELGLEKLGKVSIKLVDASGKLVVSEIVEATSLNFKHDVIMTDYASGVYVMTLSSEGKTAVKRIVKQ